MPDAPTPPPPPEWRQPPDQRQPSPWAQPWTAPPAAPPEARPGKRRTGLIATLSVGGALVVAAGVTALVYTLLDGVAATAREHESSWSAQPDGPDAPSGEDALPEPADTGPAVEEDVTIAGCERDSVMGWPSARVKVVNGSASTADYFIGVEFVDADGVVVANGLTGVVALAPGESVRKKVQGVGEVPAGTTCRFGDLSRTPSSE
ncbi:hypothetical protein ACIP6P_04535 [Streptomyces sp. NPDC088729]|uniref:hypothetical protein n=1 Tax=Streptomyces sp. NPDC088729 TaxID=3365876 RepID=UPI0038136AD4